MNWKFGKLVIIFTTFLVSLFASANVWSAGKYPYGIRVNKSKVNEVLRKVNAQNGLIYGRGFTLTSVDATAWQIKYNEPTQGQGFYESSGGIAPGRSINIRTYINSNKPNGIYNGSAVIKYFSNGSWKDGPTVSYRIILK